MAAGQAVQTEEVEEGKNEKHAIGYARVKAKGR